MSVLSSLKHSPKMNFYGRLAFWLYALLLLTKFSPIGAGLTVIPFTERLLGAHSEREKNNRLAIDDFALKGNCESSMVMKDSGVNFYFVNVTKTFSPDIKRCADEVFRNKTIVIYSFK